MSKAFKTHSWFKHYSKGLYIRKVRTQDYRASSVFVLKSIEGKYNLIENCVTILGLGTAPGCWVQYVLEVKKKTSGTYKVVAIDKMPMEYINEVCFINGEYTDCNTQTRLEVEMGMGLNTKHSKFSLILADVCASVPRDRCIVKTVLESIKSMLAFVTRFLSKKGLLLYRFFPQYQTAIRAWFRYCFRYIISIWVASTRERNGSSAMYVLCSC
ncbi:SAM-dependent methyltransferase [Candidatus Tremblaya phenacola]|uniref:Ribosomal RNA large subunit methyltransferase E n=1 Tax=Candidatus Tremblayella phenacoccinincola TaxID=1010676 RepID=A0A2G0V6Y6_9PROT|nr:SAM-dependent methyltransferase [Candidatus Tremblaya phenacola]PHN16235.1 Ribosomal RNA large subunit methyltransferase E [Candidatus Tremblaya phenacola]